MENVYLIEFDGGDFRYVTEEEERVLKKKGVKYKIFKEITLN